MKRFVKVYLTLLIVSVLTVNFILVLLYGQQFLFRAAGDGILEETGAQTAAFYINGAILAVFIVFWLIARHYFRQARSSNPAAGKKEW